MITALAAPRRTKLDDSPTIKDIDCRVKIIANHCPVEVKLKKVDIGLG